jgi:transposase
MAMGAARTGDETRQLQMVSVDELVAADDAYRRIEGVISWEAIRAAAGPFYAEDGRPSVCPAVVMKLFLVAAIEGIGSMRETLRLAERDLAIRRFLGYGLTERLPSHATVSYAQCVRFANSSIFEQLFTQVLARCRDAGLLDGRRLVVDATHVEANAALKSLRAEMSVIDGEDGEDARAEACDDDRRPALALAEPRSGPTPRRRASNATAVSRSDPDAKLRHKPGQRPHLVHRAQVATDPKARVIVAVQAEPATGHEGDALGGLTRRARWAGHAVEEIAADCGYASAAIYDELEDDGIVAFIPPQRNMLASAQGRAARVRCKTPPGVSAAIDRMTHGEGTINELKNRHGLDRARSRGTAKLQTQLLLAATAINLKRLTSRPPAASQAAGGDHEPAARPLDARSDANRPAIRAHIQIITACLTRLRRLDQLDSLTGS